MSSPPDFQTYNNSSIVSGGYDAWAPAPEIEGQKNTSYTSYSQQQRTIQDINEQVDARPPDYQTKATNSITGGASGFGLTDTRSSVVKAAPGVEVAVHDNLSGANLSSKSATSSYKPAPGYTGIGPQNLSKVDEESANNANPVNQQDIVGISLVGRRFKDVNPTAYYVEKN
ncbi:hypothetical protein Tco_0179275 [Tanacetum coccineum]